EFGSVTFFRRRLDGGPEVARARAGLSVLHASLADIALVLEVSDPRRTPGMVQERLRRGDLCFLGLDAAGRPVPPGWAPSPRSPVRSSATGIRQVEGCDAHAHQGRRRECAAARMKTLF